MHVRLPTKSRSSGSLKILPSGVAGRFVVTVPDSSQAPLFSDTANDFVSLTEFPSVLGKVAEIDSVS
jgi:hypothetical protein